MPQEIKTAKGTARIDGSQIVYIPDAGEVGTDTFKYLAETVDGVRAEAVVTVEINDTFKLDDSQFDVIQGHKTQLDVLNGIEGASLLKALKAEPKKGAVTFSGTAGNLKLFYQSKKTAKGNDVFSFQAQNRNKTKASAKVTVTIKVPIARGDLFRTNNDSTLRINFEDVLVNDDEILKENNKVVELIRI